VSTYGNQSIFSVDNETHDIFPEIVYRRKYCELEASFLRCQAKIYDAFLLRSTKLIGTRMGYPQLAPLPTLPRLRLSTLLGTVMVAVVAQAALI
jgi:hypothetical protein